MSEDTAERGTDVLDLRDRSAHEAAKVLYEALVAEADARGQDADVEVSLFTPEQDARHGFFGQGVWRVAWDAGPYDWGVKLSNDGTLKLRETGVVVRAFQWDHSGEYPETIQGDEQWYLEPYHGIDVGFVHRGRV